MTPTAKYQLFPHDLKTATSVWLVFIKKKLVPTCHDRTISLEMIMLLYCILMKIPVDIGEIICEHIDAWLLNSKEALNPSMFD